MIKSILGIFLLAMLAIVPTVNAAGEVNKCIDANGKVTYSSQPCPDDAVRETVRIRRGPVSDSGNADESAGDDGAPGSMQKLNERIASTDDPVLKAQLELTRQQCELAKTQLQRYEDAPYLVRSNDDGTQTKLSDEEAAAEKARLRSYLAQECR